MDATRRRRADPTRGVQRHAAGVQGAAANNGMRPHSGPHAEFFFFSFFSWEICVVWALLLPCCGSLFRLVAVGACRAQQAEKAQAAKNPGGLLDLGVGRSAQPAAGSRTVLLAECEARERAEQQSSRAAEQQSTSSQPGTGTGTSRV
eukprot:COSAG01_NODE_4037_length_5412_cov_5.603614_1_plen_147_part_00